MESKIKYQFSSKLWKHSSEGGWFFITVPKNYSEEIRNNLKWQEEGWGRMKAAVIIKELNWNTSIWFDTKVKSYILPVKLEIRKKLSLKDDDFLTVTILI
tara:strand:- start:428 stop:727 length:300 start_codon:yes stop_codon:yes gene_type:complete